MVEYTSTDRQWMARAIKLARNGCYTTTPNPNVGCVIVKHNQLVGEGFHLRAGEPHAEVHALRQAGEAARGATAYVTLEPCSHHGRTPPCAQGLIDAGVTRVVAAMVDPNPQVAGRGLQMLRDAGILAESGLLEAEARALNPGFIHRMQTGRPRVTVKLAMSFDGRTAMASGESQWITSSAARTDVQRLRAQSCAILSGSGTVLADNPSLNVRLDNEQPAARQPVRVIVDSQNQVLPDRKLFSLPGKIWLARTQLAEWQYPGETEQLLLPAVDSRVDLPALLDELGRRDINQVWVEAGPNLAGALLSQQLVDDIVVYMAPKLMGDNARGLFSLPGLSNMSDAIDIKINDLRQVGPDIRFTLQPVYQFRKHA